MAVTPDGSKVYVANDADDTVSVIATATNTVIGSPITVGIFPFGVAVTPDGSKVYVVNSRQHRLGDQDRDQHGDRRPDHSRQRPQYIRLVHSASKKVCWTPGQASCHGRSVAALGQKFDGLDAAATALGYRTVSELQGAITAFCEG